MAPSDTHYRQHRGLYVDGDTHAALNRVCEHDSESDDYSEKLVTFERGTRSARRLLAELIGLLAALLLLGYAGAVFAGAVFSPELADRLLHYGGKLATLAGDMPDLSWIGPFGVGVFLTLAVLPLLQRHTGRSS